MFPFILDFKNPSKTIPANAIKTMAGGKGANLVELSGIEGIVVPDGFFVSTGAYKRAIWPKSAVTELLNRLSHLNADDRKKIGELSLMIRTAIEDIPVPDDICEEIDGQLSRLGEKNGYAIRSSASAEDLPAASFAGQHDTYLNITGREAIFKHISKCWASLFTERAVVYRIQNGIDHRKVQMAVVIQKMVDPQAAGILFTADPVTSDRRVLSIDASFGLGEAMVSGLVSSDNYKVKNGNIISRKISDKKLAIIPKKEGGTTKREIESGRQGIQALTDELILKLERIGRKIEEYFGKPQDIEWCLDEDTFYIVQSRPITTLFPLPTLPQAGVSNAVKDNDHETHVYLSVGHQQMMTDPIKPLGLSFFLLTTPAPMLTAGGRLFVDVTKILNAPDSRETLLYTMGQSDPLLKDALMNIIERGDILKPLTADEKKDQQGKSNKVISSAGFRTRVENDPAIVSELIRSSQDSIEELKRTILTKSGTELFDFILEDIQQLKKILFNPQSSGVILAAMDASSWINEKMNEWLGEKNAADTLTQSVPDNITSEMGLALLDVAALIRQFPKVIDYLQHTEDDSFLDELPGIDGGMEARKAILAFLNKYGMRCAGEIDITRIRWSEKPVTLVPMILSNIRSSGTDSGAMKFDRGFQEARRKEQELTERLLQLPDGKEKADETINMISMVRNFTGYREYPKYGMINRYFIYKQALLKEADQLLQDNVIFEKEDIYYLSFNEFREAVRTKKPDYQVISQRKEDYKLYEKLIPPRVMTSDGEIIHGKYKPENLPAGAIAGLAVSSGIAEGRARVILKLEDADLNEGDILVTTFTDPSWTPLFVSIKGLVTEVGGLMTHGAVIAREYGLPAVVGVENATRLIKDGQLIRVNGTNGYVLIL